MKSSTKEVKQMTVITQVKQTLAGLKSAQASLETFSLGTDNQEAKQLYADAAKQAQTIIDKIDHGFNKSNRKNLNIINNHPKTSKKPVGFC